MSVESTKGRFVGRITGALSLFNNQFRVQVATVSGFLILWEIAGRATSDFFLAPPSAAAVALLDLFSRSAFISDLQIGLLSLLVGAFLGISSGLVIGILMGFFSVVEEFLDPYFTIMYSLPIVALIPFIVLIFGVGFMPRVFIIFLFAFIPMTINSLEGAQETPSDLREVASSFGASRVDIVRTVYLPSMIPYMLTGARLAIGRGLRGWVLAELFFLTGVGGRLLDFGNQFRIDYVFAILALFTGIGMLATHLVYVTSDWVAPWYDIEEEEVL